MSAGLVLCGRAGEWVAALGDRARLHDIYDAHGCAVYHALVEGDTQEIRELLAAVRRIPGPVLDLGCGSGRLTVPLLALGREVTALDLSPVMLELLLGRLTGPRAAAMRARCTPVCADMTAFSLPGRFAVVVLGTITISLFDGPSRLSVIASAREHLRPGGRLMISTVEFADDGPSETETESRDPRTGRRYRLLEQVSANGLRDVTILVEDGNADEVHVYTTRSRLVPAATLTAELAEAGLRVTDRHRLGGSGRPVVLLEAEVAR